MVWFEIFCFDLGVYVVILCLVVLGLNVFEIGYIVECEVKYVLNLDEVFCFVLWVSYFFNFLEKLVLVLDWIIDFFVGLIVLRLFFFLELELCDGFFEEFLLVFDLINWGI